MAFQPVSELVKVPGIDYVGRVPDELQLVQVFAAAVVKDAKNPVAEGLLIQLLTSGHLRGLIAHTGQT